MDTSDLFRVHGLIAVVTGGATGIATSLSPDITTAALY
jgi:hypothetical protein